MQTSIIVACDPNNLIGTADNKIPWFIPEDLKFFKETTLGHGIIMGRRTWESLPKKPLPKRYNAVISKTMRNTTANDTISENTPFIADNLKLAIDVFVGFGIQPFIIGGAQIYRLALEQGLVDKIIMTRVRKSYEGNVYFPKEWESTFRKNKVLLEHKDFEVIEYTKIYLSVPLPKSTFV
jgi:dihydrofolate reductase